MQNLKAKIVNKIRPLVEKVSPGLAKTGYGNYSASKVGEENEVVLENWNSEEGQRRLFRAKYNKAFFDLAHVYQPQLNPFYAGVACTVTTLNALRVDKGTIPNQDGFDYTDPEGNEYHYTLYSQLTLLNEKTERVKKKSDIAPSILEEEIRATKEFNPGLNLYQVMHILEVYDANVEMHYAEEEAEKNIAEFSEDLRRTLNDEDSVFIANFDGEVIGLETGGHFSVIGAYDEISESVLVLDTAAHKNPWYWVPLHHLYHAMHTKHGEQYRGYLIVSDKK